MTTKEKIILQSIEVIKSRLSEIDRIIDFNPFAEIRKVREQAQELLDANETAEEKYSASFVKQILLLIREEQKIIIASQKRNCTIELFDEKHKLHK